MSNNPVTSINARNLGTTRFLTGSTPRTCNASSSSRILRAPKSAVIAVPATPARTIASTNGANSRILANTKNPPRRSSAPKSTRKLAACRPGAPYPNATVETRSGNQHSFSAKRNWLTNSPPYGYGGLRADMIVLPVRIIMSPTSSSRFLTGKNPRSATPRTTSPSPPGCCASSLAHYITGFRSCQTVCGLRGTLWCVKDQGPPSIRLDRDSEVPLGVQLAWHLRAAMAAGELGSDARLPSVREMAAATGVNANTVRAVYARLEAEGLVATEHGRGTFVTGEPAAHGALSEIARRAAAEARAAGVDPRAVAAALFVTGEAPAAPPEATRRRALRAEIAELERRLAATHHQRRMALHADDPLAAPAPSAPRGRLL